MGEIEVGGGEEGAGIELVTSSCVVSSRWEEKELLKWPVGPWCFQQDDWISGSTKRHG